MPWLVLVVQYLGGKARIAQELALAVLRHTNARELLLEPFCGAASVTSVLAPHFAAVQAADTSPDLCLMLAAVRDGWQPPEHVTPEDYAAQRAAPASALRAFVGYGCSFGGKWFGGYARCYSQASNNFAKRAKESLARKVAIGKGLGNVQFLCRPYWDTPAIPGAVIYCDPPYAGTTSPGQRIPFDSGKFWTWATAMGAAGCRVLVSEQDAPPGWERLVLFDHRLALRTTDGRKFREALWALPYGTSHGTQRGTEGPQTTPVGT